jgi:hypothetical protein
MDTVMNASPAQAAGGGFVLLAAPNSETTVTSITNTNTTGANDGFIATGGGSGVGVTGHGGNSSGTGVKGVGGGTNGIGVFGEGPSGAVGVLGFGIGGGGVGVEGVSFSGAGAGVHGEAETSSGVGVAAVNPAGGPALQVSGRALFSSSGLVVVPSGHTTATVRPVGGLSSKALVLAVMQNVAGGVMVKAAVPNPGAGTFQVVLNQAPSPSAKAKVAWFVLN